MLPPRHRLLIVAICACLALYALLHDQVHQLTVVKLLRNSQHLARSRIPEDIWQIFLKPPNAGTNFTIDAGRLNLTTTWLAKNPDYTYHLVGEEGASRILNGNKFSNKKIKKLFESLPNTGMKSDLLRYLILAEKGGVYSDTDTVALQPVNLWIPEQYRQHARVIVGIEFDRLDGPNWGEVHPDLQFCQWTIAAAPKHPLLQSMVQRVVTGLEEHLETNHMTMENMEIDAGSVINLTGPSAWTEAVFDQLRLYKPSLTTVRNFTGLVEPTLIGDILVLPIDGFGMGQPHSNSTNNGTIPEDAFVKHMFNGSWRKEVNDQEEAKEKESQES